MTTTPDFATVVARLRWLLAVSALSQRSFSDASGLTESFLSVFFMRAKDRAEEATLDVASARSIVAAFGGSPSWLLFGEGEAPTESDVRAGAERYRTAEAAKTLPATGTDG